MPRRRSRSSRRTSASACSPRASRRRFASRKRPSRECRSSSTIRTGWPPSPIAISRRRFSPMASGKRASMREGPLAALFRGTDEAPASADERSGPPPADAPRSPATGSATPPPATAAGQQEGRAPQAPSQDDAREAQREPAQGRPPEQDPQDRDAEPHPRETGYPHPSLGATPPPVELEEPRVPSPQERL